MRPLLILAAPLLLFAVPAGAQVGAYPTATQSDADRLAAAIRRVGAAPRDLNALIEAGELSVKVGDATAAAALFKRAEQIDPNNGRVKAGIARILVNGEHPGEALRYFALAERTGLVMTSYAADRGLAYDLIGEQERAQRDYRLALRQADDDEVRRRYALSLGIAGKQAEALQEIDALLRKSDRGAWRARAFILAMNGDLAGANRIATSMMPSGMASGMTAFFQRLPTLGAADRAFAVHFGEVTPTPTRLADARLAPILPPLGPDPYAPRPVQVAAATPVATTPQPVDRRDRRRSRDRRQSAPTVQPAPTQTASVVTAPVQTAARTPVPTYPPVQTAARPYSPAPTTTSQAAPRPTVAPAYAQPVQTAPRVAPTPAQSVAATSPTPTLNRPAGTLAAAPVVTGQSTGGAGVVPATVPPAAALAASPNAIRPGAPVSTTLPREASALPTAAPIQQAATAIPGVVPAVTAAPAPRPATVAATVPPPAAVVRPATRPANPAPSANESILARIVAGIVVPPSELATAPVPPARPATASGSLDRAARRAETRSAQVEDAARPLTPAQRRIAARTAAAAAAEEPAPKPLTAAERRAKALADRKAKEDAAAKKALADKAAAEKKAARAEPARYWVQVAGGANARDLDRAWSAAQKKAPALAGKKAFTTPLRATNRVVTGPYKTEAEARAMVNTLSKQGLSAFTFASEAGQKMSRLGSE